MKHTVIFVFMSSLLFSLQAFTKSNVMTGIGNTLPNKIELASNPQYYLKYDEGGNVLIQLNYKNKGITVNSALAYTLSDKLEEIAKSACELKARPETVTVSIMFLSATWNTDKLCNEKNESIRKKKGFK